MELWLSAFLRQACHPPTQFLSAEEHLQCSSWAASQATPTHSLGWFHACPMPSISEPQAFKTRKLESQGAALCAVGCLMSLASVISSLHKANWSWTHSLGLNLHFSWLKILIMLSGAFSSIYLLFSLTCDAFKILTCLIIGLESCLYILEAHPLSSYMWLLAHLFILLTVFSREYTCYSRNHWIIFFLLWIIFCC